MPKRPSEQWETGPSKDASNNSNVNLGTQLAGEDITADLIKVEQRYTYAALNSLVTITPKSTAGFLHAINIGGYSGPTIELYDNTAASGTLIGRLNAAVPPATYTFNVPFSNGLTVNPQPGTTILPNATIIYR